MPYYIDAQSYVLLNIYPWMLGTVTPLSLIYHIFPIIYTLLYVLLNIYLWMLGILINAQSKPTLDPINTHPINTRFIITHLINTHSYYHSNLLKPMLARGELRCIPD